MRNIGMTTPKSQHPINSLWQTRFIIRAHQVSGNKLKLSLGKLPSHWKYLCMAEHWVVGQSQLTPLTVLMKGFIIWPCCIQNSTSSLLNHKIHRHSSLPECISEQYDNQICHWKFLPFIDHDRSSTSSIHKIRFGNDADTRDLILDAALLFQLLITLYISSRIVRNVLLSCTWMLLPIQHPVWFTSNTSFGTTRYIANYVQTNLHCCSPNTGLV